jgi:hypothetical protein
MPERSGNTEWREKFDGAVQEQVAGVAMLAGAQIRQARFGVIRRG